MTRCGGSGLASALTCEDLLGDCTALWTAVLLVAALGGEVGSGVLVRPLRPVASPNKSPWKRLSDSCRLGGICESTAFVIVHQADSKYADGTFVEIFSML